MVARTLAMAAVVGGMGWDKLITVAICIGALTALCLDNKLDAVAVVSTVTAVLGYIFGASSMQRTEDNKKGE